VNLVGITIEIYYDGRPYERRTSQSVTSQKYIELCVSSTVFIIAQGNMRATCCD